MHPMPAVHLDLLRRCYIKRLITFNIKIYVLFIKNKKVCTSEQ
jgi:hypothetical protein